jgi:hypothetical protein
VVKKGKNVSTLHIFFDNVYNSHCILQYRNDTIKFTPKVALRHAILNTIYACYCLHASNAATTGTAYSV